MTEFLIVILVALSVCFLVSLVRWVKGPQIADRIILFDLLTALICGMLVVISLVFDAAIFLDIALLLAVISFISSIGLAYWLEKGTDT
jgi:multicomponent Na+:H+ antiporter subunit F